MNLIPMDHTTALVGVLDATRLMAENPAKSEDEIVECLRARGYSEVDAEKLNVFVPSAFAWVLLKRMGVSSFPTSYVALNRDGNEVLFPVGGEHFFTAALHLAYQTMEEGWTEVLAQSAFEAVISRSAELNAANKALNESKSLVGGAVAALRVYRFSAEEAAGEA